MRPINIRIRHYNDAFIAQIIKLKVSAKFAPRGQHNVRDFLVGANFVFCGVNPVDQLVEDLMGKSAEARFNFIQANAEYADELDI